RSGVSAIEVHVVPVASDRAIEHLESDQLSRRALGFLTLQHIEPEKLLLLPSDNPSEVGFDDGGGFVHVVAVETHRGFETKRVTCAEAGRNDTRRCARSQD